MTARGSRISIKTFQDKPSSSLNKYLQTIPSVSRQSVNYILHIIGKIGRTMQIKEVSKERRADAKFRTTIVCLDDNGNELGYLVYSEPDLCKDKELRLHILWVYPYSRRNHIGSKLLDHVKNLAAKDYNSIQITAYIKPLESRLKLNNLINFYTKNNFYVEKLSYKDAWGVFEFIE